MAWQLNVELQFFKKLEAGQEWWNDVEYAEGMMNFQAKQKIDQLQPARKKKIRNSNTATNK